MPLPYMTQDDLDALQRIQAVLSDNSVSDRDALLKALRMAAALLVNTSIAELSPQSSPPPVVTKNGD